MNEDEACEENLTIITSGSADSVVKTIHLVGLHRFVSTVLKPTWIKAVNWRATPFTVC